MFKLWDHHGILGINARNLLYIKPLNKKAQIKFADDKMRTKQYLSARGIQTARLLGKITSEAELLKFPWDSLPNEFVLKPNAGYGGEGIVVITSRDQDMDGWRTGKGKLWVKEDLFEHCSDILDGRYSITGSADTVFFEQLLKSHPDMKNIGQFGLPDIRVIVYNLVPVMAMLRVPTQESNGKANLHVGGLGLGVDLAKGEITHMVHYDKIIKEHPDFGSLKGIKIPYWEDTLLLATQIQQMITLGYLAVDIVLDADAGPTLLEINARAGLAVQTANLAPLRDRLDRVAGVKVSTPEKGVRMAQDLFGNKIERSIQALSGKKVIGMEESVTLHLKQGTTTIVGKMNPTMNKNYLDKELFMKIADDPDAENLTLSYSLQGERGKNLFHPLEMTDSESQVIFGKKALSNFFLDVTKTGEEKKIPSIEPAAIAPAPAGDHQQEYWQKMDNLIVSIDQKLSLISQLRPTNLDTEREQFFKNPHKAPQFTYKNAPENLLELKTELQRLHFDMNHPLGRLLDGKRKELMAKADLIEVIGDDEHFPSRSELFFGVPPDDVRKKAKKALEKLEPEEQHRRSIPTEKVAEEMQAFLKDKGLHNWLVKIKDGIVSRCVLAKHNRLLMKGSEKFSRWDVDKLIAHEIEVHVYCTENGKEQPFQILQRGTAHYLKTQEGLAVYWQDKAVKDGIRNSIIGFQAVMWGREMGFVELFEKLCTLGTKKQAWSTAVKVKRGMSDTSLPGAFMKNALYYWGYLEVIHFLDQGGAFEDLFYGKYSIADVDLVKELEGLVKPKYLPDFENPAA